jgi:hypothetical protein
MTNENAITYDYKTIKVKREMETMAADSYANLGWELTGSSVAEGAIFHVNLSFKRDRKIEGKAKLLKLQEKADNILLNIESLQNGKKTAGNIPSLSVGIVGALTLGGGMSMVMMLEGVGFMVGGIALGLVGIGICLLAFAVYKKVRKTKLAKINPILESEFDKLADVCEETRK